MLQGLRTLEAAAIHPLDLLSLNVWVICACTGVLFGLLQL